MSSEAPVPLTSATIITISCEEDNCSECDADIDQLPIYLNEYGKDHSCCLICQGSTICTTPLEGKETVKTIKEVCIRSILPDITLERNLLDKSYPFCELCTELKVTKLLDLYRQLHSLQEEFESVRSPLVKGVIECFVRDKGNGRSGEKLFKYWKRYVGNQFGGLGDESFLNDSDFECDELGVEKEKMKNVGIPLPIPSSPDSNHSGSEQAEQQLSDQLVRIKSEPLDEDVDFDQNELLPVLHMDNSQNHLQADLEEGGLFTSNNLPNFLGFENSEHSENQIYQKNAANSFINQFENGQQIPVVYTATDHKKPQSSQTSKNRRKLTKKYLLSEKQGEKQRLVIIKNKVGKHKRRKGVVRGGASDSESSLSSSSSRLALKAKRKAIRTLIRDPLQNNKLVKLTTSHRHRHSKKQKSEQEKEKHQNSLLPLPEEELILPHDLELPLISEIKPDPEDFDSRPETPMSEVEPPDYDYSANSFDPPEEEIQKPAKKSRSSKRKRKTPAKKENRTRNPKTRKCKKRIKNSTVRKRGRPKKNSHPEERNSKRKTSLRKNSSKRGGSGANYSSSSGDERRSQSPSSHSDEEVFDMFKCTPNIIEGNQEMEFGTSHNNTPSNYYSIEDLYQQGDNIPLYFHSEGEDSDSFASPPKKKQKSTSKSQNNKERSQTAQVDDEEEDAIHNAFGVGYDDDSSDDYTDRPSRSKKKTKRGSPRDKKKKEPKKKTDSLKAPKKPKTTSGFGSDSSGSDSPTQLGDEVDLTQPLHVNAFSALLTGSVRSILPKFDPSPSPVRRSKSQPKMYFDGTSEASDNQDAGSNYELDEMEAADVNSDDNKTKTEKSKPAQKRKRPRSTSTNKSATKKDANGSVPRRARSRKPKSEAAESGGPKERRVNIPRQCQVCGKVLMNAYNLTVHMRVHTGEKNYVCDVAGCGKRFYKPENLRTHLRSHSQERPYACSVCKCKFAYNFVLRTHKAAKHGIYDSEALFTCRACDQKFIVESLFIKHQPKCKQGGNDEPRVLCTYCNQSFEHGDDFKAHQASEQHLEMKRVKLMEARSMALSAKQVANETVEINCEACNEKFPDDRLYQLHYRKAHNNSTPMPLLTCEVCGKQLSTLGALKTHQIIHSEDKPFICQAENCNEKFNTKASLQNHSIKHLQTPFKCGYCGKGCYKERILKRHMCTNHKEVHLKDKPHICPSCYSNFETTEQLGIHLEEHSDLTCKICGKVFGFKYDLRRHLRHQHPQDPMPMEVGNYEEGEERSDGGDSEKEIEAKKKAKNRKNQKTTSTATSQGPSHLGPMGFMPMMNFEQQYAVLSQDHHQQQQQQQQHQQQHPQNYSMMNFMYHQIP